MKMRIDQLTFTRFLAAVAIVIYHFGKQVFPFNIERLSFLIKQANIGVSYFFILSGFIMIISYGKGIHVNFFEYLKNRIARIYPVYLLGILLYLPIRFLINYPPNITLGAHVAMIQSWIPGWIMSYNFPGWSVSVEMFFYFSFPFLYNYFYLRNKRISLIFGLIFLFWILSQCFFHIMLQQPYYKGEFTPSHEFLYYNPLLHLNEFLIGNAAGIWFLKNQEKRQGNYDVAIVLCLICIALGLKFPMGMNYHNGLFGFLLVPLIVFISLNTGSITRLFSNNKLVFLGEISYGIYIYQLPVFYYLKPLPFQYSGWVLCFKLIILFLVSALSYVYIEVPLRNKIKSINWRFP